MEAANEWTYGSIIVNEIGTATQKEKGWRLGPDYEAGDGSYSLMLFLNSTSGDVSAFWGAYAQ